MTQSERFITHNHSPLFALTQPDVALRCRLQELDTEVETCKILSELCAVHT